MNAIKILAIAILVPFSVLSAYALAQVGYVGIIEYQLPSPAGWQVLTDLVISLLLICLWMIQDARRTGRSVWPYLVASFFLGSFGVLFYLLLAPAESRDAVGQAA
jgi:hypothetical protein